MEHDDLREILERLEALERLARSRSGEHGGRDEHRRGGRDRRDSGRREDGRHRDRHDEGRHRDRHDRDRHGHGGDDRRRGGDGDFQEKRIIDTIVRLVGERLERFMQDQQAKTQRRDDRGNEKQVVDLVVRLVSEHVREIVQGIVSTELDRRLGPPGGERQGSPSPNGEGESE